MSKKIIFSGGGTGGHIFPAINLMKHFFDKRYEVILVTDDRGNHFIENHLKFKSYILKTGTPTNKNLLKKFLSYFLIFYSIVRSILIIKKEKPNLVFGFGGYVSFPISFASRFFKLPLIIYENNMVLGRANKYLSSFSKKILLAKKITKNLPEHCTSKTYEVGSILNKNIINISSIKKSYKKKFFSFLVVGGSQGAEIFAKVIPMVMKMIKDEGYEIEINQQCTIGQKSSLIDFYEKHNIKNYVFEFDKNILKLILSSTIAITRCGASTIAELVNTSTPFIAVPLPNSIDNHQYLNAKHYENSGCCWLLEQNNFNTKNLFNLIVENIKNENKLQNIRENMKKNYDKNVYQNIENEIKEFIKT
jgi:UDP-N-acetylglucosamine--N-acetylmuramyl-(pentapeptide) pyrophosphoryl-undecaprenol N-acetylglucosamine transferase